MLDDTGSVIATASEINGLFKLDIVEANSRVFEVSCKGNESKDNQGSHELRHRGLGHANRISVKLLHEGLVTGVSFVRNDNKSNCVACATGKLPRKTFKQNKKRASRTLELLHMDLCGPFRVATPNGAKYCLCILDDYSRMRFIYFLKSKEETSENIMDFKVMVENKLDGRIKAVQTDNGTEFCKAILEKFFTQHGICHQRSAPRNPEMNGRIERLNRTLGEAARSMMLDAGCMEYLWGEAFHTAVYLKNRLPHKALPGYTPYELWFGKKPGLSYLRVFGCEAYSHVPKECRNKLQAKAKKIMLDILKMVHIGCLIQTVQLI